MNTQYAQTKKQLMVSRKYYKIILIFTGLLSTLVNADHTHEHSVIHHVNNVVPEPHKQRRYLIFYEATKKNY